MKARLALVAGAAALPAFALAAPALAHTELVSTTPKKGSVVKHLPSTIVMSFTEAPIRVVSAKVVSKGAQHGKGAKLNPKNHRQILVATRNDTVGPYRVSVTLIAPDGHAQLVPLSFRVRR
jgi:methionine-rich copper-binding protein CopC